jgi:hypothetical protein
VLDIPLIPNYHVVMKLFLIEDEIEGSMTLDEEEFLSIHDQIKKKTISKFEALEVGDKMEIAGFRILRNGRQRREYKMTFVTRLE